jgi:hypothetical protein
VTEEVPDLGGIFSQERNVGIPVDPSLRANQQIERPAARQPLPTIESGEES